MINYHYIIDFISLSDEQIDYIINNIIFKYSYPCCTNINNELTDTEKEEIINDEFNFIKNKIHKYCDKEIEIIQIPRIIYDLFNIYIQIKLYMDNNKLSIVLLKIYELKFNELFFNVENKYNNLSIYHYSNFIEYCNNLSQIQNNIYSFIINLNNLIFNKLKLDSYKFINEDLYEYWKHILNNIINDIYIYYPDYTKLFLKYKDELNKQYSLINKLYIINDKKILKDDIQNNIRYKYNYYTIILFTDNKYDLRTFNNQELLNNILKIDLNYNKTDKNKIVLYKNLYYCKYDKCTNNDEISLLFYCTSIFDSLFSDYEDTIFYSFNKEKKYNCDKYLLISKNFKSNDDHKIIFIPPIHPALSLNCYGFNGFSRNKAPNDAKSTNYKKRIYSYDENIHHDNNLSNIPNYLKSPFNKEELIELCKNKEEQSINIFEKQIDIIDNKIDIIDNKINLYQLKYIKKISF